jgi:hypothetical protein
MKNLALFLATALLFAAAPACAAELNTKTTLIDTTGPSGPVSEPQFAKVIDDLPLMPGLTLVPDSDVLFAEPLAGRIAETTAAGSVDIDDVYKFYRRSLPQLGWKIVDGRTYRREGDLLRIDARADGKITTVRFSVKPNGAAR